MVNEIQAVTVCMGYGDYLEQVIGFNKQFFDRWIIVTTPEDHRTQGVCAAHGVECLPTNVLRQFGPFSKGAGINQALEKLEVNKWALLLDCDICLPTDFADSMNDADLQIGVLYGTNRINITGWDNWVTLKKTSMACRHEGWLLDFRRWPGTVGGIPARHGEGYVPIGFFQLFHASELVLNKRRHKYVGKRYPDDGPTGAGTDMDFALLWERPFRQLIPELAVFHLETPDTQMGANWQGRKSPEFGPYPSTMVGR